LRARRLDHEFGFQVAKAHSRPEGKPKRPADSTAGVGDRGAQTLVQAMAANVDGRIR
jgi:hypothetical protein